MRKQFFTALFIFLSVALASNAQQRSLADAAKVAEDFFQTKGSNASVSALQISSKKGLHKLLRKSANDKTSQAYYLFNNEDNKQLVIVSGDERMRTILGYTDKALSGNILPDGLIDLLDGYKAQYKALSATATTPARSALYKGERLLETALWGQWAPFNQMTPNSYPTGCAATAMAIVMRYHQWPLVGNGSKTHIWKDDRMVGNFGETHYDWANMPTNYKNGYTTEQAEAVALLMRHLGISVEMYYDAESSGARQTLVPTALIQYFRYGATARLLTAADYDAATWDKMMRKEIDENRPVIYTGESVQGRGAHGFVLDGYRDNLFHFNFGWTGDGNGYFAISAITATNSSFEFANKQQAVIGIKPLKEDECAPLVLESQKTYDGFYTTLTTLTANNSVSIHLSKLTAQRDWKGQLQWNLCHADGTVVESLGNKSVNINAANTQGVDFTFTAINNAVAGDYLQLVARNESATDWKPVLNVLGTEVKLQAYGRKVPVVVIERELKNVAFDDKDKGNVLYEGKPLLGSTYTYQVTPNTGVVKSIIQEHLCGETYVPRTGTSIMLTTDSLYIKAKAFNASELVAECNVNVEKAGQLENTIEKQAYDADAVEALTITGELNDYDLQYLSTLQSLKELNLENATTPQGLFGAPFKGFGRLTTCELPRSLKQLGSETFKNCTSLKSISLPVSLQATGGKILSGCNALTDIYVRPSSPDCVSTDAFSDLPNPANVTIHVQQGLISNFKANAKWSSFSTFVDDLAALPKSLTYDGIDYKAIYDGDGNYLEVTIPSGEMYKGNITIPANITYQGIEYTVRGFDNSNGLSPFVGNPFITSLNLQLHVESLGAMMFMGCTSLENLQLPSTLRTIGNECFRNCPMLKQITLPASVESLGDNAFCGCQFLTDIFSYPSVPPTGSNNDNYPFAQCRPNNVTVHVPASCVNAYSATGFWTKFNNIVGDLPDNVVAVDNITIADADALPIKATGKQWLTLHLDKMQSVAIYNLNGALQRTLLLPQGENRIWIDEASVLVAQ